ncbi:sulfatase [Verrucomicrobiales bacterium BCK34]|nr:sulfatase [Verrucomicrobiales bacterium BCK34]
MRPYLLAGVLLFIATYSFAEGEKWNLIFLLSDDQSTYSMGCYGNEDVKTPQMDQLAADGMIFDNHYDTTAICMASRANILTGLFEYRTGTNFEHGHMLNKKWAKSYPVLLREAGYQTAFAGKFGLEVTDKPDARKGYLPESDFDRWGGGPGQTHYKTKSNKSMAKYAKEFPHSTLSYGAFGRDFIIDAAKEDAPFCLSISFKAPHMPATPDPRFDDVYAGKTFKKPENYGREHGGHFSEQSRQGRQYERFESWGYKDNYDKVMATYHQQIYAIDVALGMIREAVETAGVAGNTAIIYTSDNGFLCGSHGYGSKVLPYEEASRVPLIIYLPGHENSGKGIRCDALTGNVDFHPTLLELAGLEPLKGVDGKSLVSLYDNPAGTIHTQLPLINVWGPKEAHSLSVVTKDWKYVRWPYNEGGYEATEELFFTSEDPGELENQLNNPSHRSVLEQMRKRYDGEVQSWEEKAVPYHNYQPFGSFFRRE